MFYSVSMPLFLFSAIEIRPDMVAMKAASRYSCPSGFTVYA